MSPPYGNTGGYIIEHTPCAFLFLYSYYFNASTTEILAMAVMLPIAVQTKMPTEDNKDRHTYCSTCMLLYDVIYM